MDADLKELLDLQEKLKTRINAYWTYWSVAIFAIMGWMVSEKHDFTLLQAIAIAIGAAIFFLANLITLWFPIRLISGVKDEIRLKAGSITLLSHKLSGTLQMEEMVHRWPFTLILHLLVDIIVLCVIVTRSCSGGVLPDPDLSTMRYPDGAARAEKR